MLKKPRSPNFSNAEVMHLLRLVEQYPIIQNKKTDAAARRDKQAAWQSITEEYNSQTEFCPRTANNLIWCYKNQKHKIKKQFLNEEIVIQAPLLLDPVEEHGQDLSVADEATETSLVRKNTFDSVNAAKSEESVQNKIIYQTGGSPQQTFRGDTIVEVKIEASLEGLNTTYDEDPELDPEKSIEQEQSSVGDKSQQPIESENEDIGCTSDQNQSNIKKRKSLEYLKEEKKRVKESYSYEDLESYKKDLVMAQKKVVEYQIEEQKLLIELAQEKLNFEKKKNKMKLDFLKQKCELELNLLRKMI